MLDGWECLTMLEARDGKNSNQMLKADGSLWYMFYHLPLAFPFFFVYDDKAAR